ncbi:MAG: hypothetical protein KFW21_04325 [Spirochaetota bacterium]|nr:hypothetical protein [Spirochaetota bacterium]
MVLEDNLVELNKQEIFHQIDREILSKKNNEFSIMQKTRSNYKFVLYLDLIACLIAIFGAIVVYSVFKEQQVRLVSGQNGVKVLETTLIEEINKQYEQNLLLKELELQELRSKLENIELEFSNILLKIQQESQQKLEIEKALLQKELLSKLSGKNQLEQDLLRQEYNQKLELIKQNIDLSKVENENIEKKKFEQFQKNLQQQDELQRQLEEVKEKLEFSKEKLETIVIKQPQVDIEKIYKDKESQKIEQRIFKYFINIQQNISEKKYAQAEISLNNIEKIYENDLSHQYLKNRKRADLYFISLNREFIQKDKEVMKLNKKLDIQSNQIKSLEQKFITPKNFENTKDSQIIIDKINFFIEKVSNNKVSKKEIEQYIKNINKELPEVTNFAYKYVEFTQNIDHDKISKAIQSADELVLKKDYSTAISAYQQILRVYLFNNSRDSVVDKLYKTIILQLENSKNKTLVANNIIQDKTPINIPKNVNEKIKKVLNNMEFITPEYKIIYMRNPDGYVLNIVDENHVLIILTAGKRVFQNQQLKVYRVSGQDIFKMDKVGFINVLKLGGDIIQTSNFNSDLRIGDLIYI